MYFTTVKENFLKRPIHQVLIGAAVAPITALRNVLTVTCTGTESME